MYIENDANLAQKNSEILRRELEVNGHVWQSNSESPSLVRQGTRVFERNSRGLQFPKFCEGGRYFGVFY